AGPAVTGVGKFHRHSGACAGCTYHRSHTGVRQRRAMKTTGLMTALLIMLAAFGSVNAQDDKPNWAEKFPNYELLGEKKVDFGADKDTIEVGAREGRYVSLMIGVVEGNLEMWDIKVTFGNDES